MAEANIFAAVPAGGEDFSFDIINYLVKIFVKAKPGAGENRVDKIDDRNFIVSVKEPPVQGRANRAIIRILAEYFNISLSRIHIVSGHVSRQKIVEVG